MDDRMEGRLAGLVPLDIPHPAIPASHYERILSALGAATPSRRSLLLGIGSSSVIVPLVGHAARAANNFSVQGDRNSVELLVGRTPAWRLDAQWFDGAPKLRVQSSRDSLRVELNDALFPGTDIPANLFLKAQRNGGEWAAHLRMPGVGFEARTRFHLWLLGLEAAEASFRLPAAEVRAGRELRFSNLTGRLRMAADWTFTASAIDEGSALFDAQPLKVSDWRLQLAAAGEAAIPMDPKTWIWSRVSGHHAADFGDTQPGLELRGDTSSFIDAGRDRATLTLSADGEGAGALRWKERGCIDLPLRSAALTRSYTPQGESCVARAVPGGDGWVRFDGGSVRFSIPPGRGVLLASTESPGVPPSREDPQAAEFVVALHGSDQAVFKRRVASADEETKHHPLADAFQFARYDIRLDPYDLVLRRAVDGLFCTIRFRNVQLRQNLRGWYLAGVGNGTPEQSPLIEFDFGSQHVREEAVYFTDWCQDARTPVVDTLPVPDEVAALALIRISGANSPYPAGLPKPNPAFPMGQFIAQLKEKDSRETFDKFRGTQQAKNMSSRAASASCQPAGSGITRHQPAGATHLTFRFQPGETLPLGMDALFSWSEGSEPARGQAKLEPVFSRRAARPGTLSLNKDAERGDPLDEMITNPASVISSRPKINDPAFSHHEYATRIEAPAQLVVSPVPDRNGVMPGWTLASPAGASSAGATAVVELWSARMSRVGVRALYSSRASFVGGTETEWGGKIDVFSPPLPFNASSPLEKDFRASYDARDLHELVSLTAVYNFKALCGSKQVQGCNLDDGPTVNTHTPAGEGVSFKPGRYMPVPMSAEILLLTSQGATFRYRGAWSPPASHESRGALTVMRYDHDAQLGRDTYARIEYKGFLFPLGQPAILIKLTDRRFCLEGKRWVARLVQRFFIHVPEFKRSFKAVGQPHDRLWGHAETGMRSFTTPDLVEPSKDSVGGLGVAAFWPRVPGEGNTAKDVIFEFEDTLTRTTYAAPLVFVDNHVAHNKDMLKKVVDAWREEVKTRTGWKLAAWKEQFPRYFAQVTSAKLPYLPGERSENTDIETSRILLGVAVPLDNGYDDKPVLDATRLMVTPRMEADNQPPFYPVRRRAETASTQLAVLTGNAAGRYLVEFDAVYLESGLDGAGNAAKVFGVFVDVAPHMNFGEDTSRSGGFASPSTKAVWLSRTRGLIGGPADKLVQVGAAAPAGLAGKSESNQPGQQTGHADDFNPKEYFAEVLGDAKLLGVVRLVDVLEVLLVTTGTEIPTIKRQDLYDLALPALRAAVDFILARTRDAGKWFKQGYFPQDSPEGIAADRLRPDWERLMSAVGSADRLVKESAPDPASILSAANAIGAASDKLAASVRAIVNDPVVLLPQAMAQFIKTARETLDLLRTLLPPAAVTKALLAVAGAVAEAALREQLRTLIADLASSPAYARVRAALVRVDDLLAELLAARDDARKTLEAIRDNLFIELKTAIADVTQQLVCFEQIAAGACTALAAQLTSEIKAQVSTAGSKTDRIVKACVAMSTMVGRAIAGQEAAHPAQAPAFAAARRSAVVLMNILNSEADALLELHKRAGEIQKWGGPCAPGSSEELQNLGRDAIEYVLLAPDRVVRSMAALVEIGKAVPADYAALARQWYDMFQPDGLLANCIEALDGLANAVQGALLAVLKQELAHAAAQVNLLRSELQRARARSEFELGAEIRKFVDERSEQVKQASEAFQAVQGLLQAMRALSPEAAQAAIRANIRARLQAVRTGLENRVRKVVDDQLALVLADLCSRLQDRKLGVVLNELVPEDNSPSVYTYLSQELKVAIKKLRTAVLNCGTKTIEEIIQPAVEVADLLSRAASSGNPGQLLDLEQIMNDIVTQLGVPTRVRIDYDWSTTVSETPKGNSAVFEPKGERKLRISSVIEASLTGGRPSISLEATLTPFAIHLFGKTGGSNFLSIHFDALKLRAQPGQALDCKTDVTLVEPGKALGFVSRLSALFGGRSGFYLLPSTRGIEVGYQYSKPYDVLGGFIVQNINFSIAASLPFDNSPVRTTLKLAEKEKPFLISAGIYGGGGFLCVRTRADTLEVLEASFEYGAMAAFGYGPVTGTGRITAGIYIRMGGRQPVIEGFFCAAGEASVAGLIHVSAMLRVVISNQLNSGQVSGEAVYTFSFSLGIFDYTYSAAVAYAKGGDSGGGGQAALPADERVLLASAPLPADSAVASDGPGLYAGLLSPAKAEPSIAEDRHLGLLHGGAWKRYWAAFTPEPRPDRNEWTTISREAKTRALQAGRPWPPEAAHLAGLGRVMWYVVPWGVSAGTLRIGLRAMPVVLEQDSPARRNWPGLLAGVPQLELALYKATRNSEGKITGHEKTGQRTIDIGAKYRARLAEWGLTVQDAERLWQAIFPPELEMPGVADVDLSRDKGRQLAIHSTADLSQLAGRRAGLLFADALGHFERPGDQALQTYATPKFATAPLQAALLGAAEAYVPVTGRTEFVAIARVKSDAYDSSSNRLLSNKDYQDWIDQNFLVPPAAGKAGKPRAAGLSIPYSAAALNTMRGLFTPLRTGMGLSLEDPFAQQFVMRQAAYMSSGTPAEKTKKENFHQRLAGLASHPWLMKVLGLVVDLDVADAQDADAICVANWGADVVPTKRFRTLVKNGFARERGDDKETRPSGAEGLVDISAPAGRFVLTQIDVDRTPQRLMQTAIAWRNEVLSGIRPGDVPVVLQPQETVGLSLIEQKESGDKNAPDSKAEKEEDLYCDQLSIGLRPDVQVLVPDQDPAGARIRPWTSLTARRIRRVLLRGRDITDLFRRINGMTDEGMIVEAVRKLNPEDAKSQYLVEGERVRWDSWVIGVPRPDADGAPMMETPETGLPAAPAAVLSGLSVEYEAMPGATPQRFGLGYRMGVRRVMADGNSIALEEAERNGYPAHSLGDESTGKGHSPFLRFEPIAPPLVLIEGLPRRNALRPEKAHRAAVTLGEEGRCRRVLVPPRCASIELAIRHGVFDGDRMRDAPPAGAFGEAILTAEGDFPSFLFAYTGVQGGKHDTEERYFRRLAGGAPPPRIPYYPDPWAKRAILGFYRASDDRLMYIDHFDYYPAGRSWPYAQELEIEIIPVATVPDMVRGFELGCEANRRTIRLAPGTHLKLRVWHEIDVEMLNQSAIVDQIVQAACDPEAGDQIRRGLQCRSAAPQEVRERVIERLSRWHEMRQETATPARPAFGCSSDLLNMTSFWMLNPLQEVDLLHAAPLPVRRPSLSDSTRAGAPAIAHSPSPTSEIEEPFRVVRVESETAARFAGHVRLDRATTRHIDAQARWRDNAGTASAGVGGAKMLKVEERRGLLFQLREIAPIAKDSCGMPPSSPMAPELDAHQHLQLLEAEIPVSPDRAVPCRPVTTPYDFGDTRARVIEVELLAQARHAIEFEPGRDPAREADRFTLRSLPQRVVVPATCRPEPPAVEYVMPLYSWKNTAADRGSRRTREAGWFRIWLGPQWYSSGNGELLALVCWHAALFDPLDRSFQLSRTRQTSHHFLAPSKLVEPFVTRWGLDPLAGQDIEFGNMPASAFRNRLRTRAQMAAHPDEALAADAHHLLDVNTFEPLVDLKHLPDAPPAAGDAMKAVLALYRPRFDRATGRWFADIQLDPQLAYQPFVRLALARWQPHALHGENLDLRLSRVVVSEFVQLLPERSVTITPVSPGRGAREYKVVVAGTMLDKSKSSGASEWNLRVEERHADRAGDSWTPVANVLDDKGALVRGATPFQAGDSIRMAQVRVPERAAGSYSIVLEEHETFAGNCGPAHSRLVYFDRLVLAS